MVKRLFGSCWACEQRLETISEITVLIRSRLPDASMPESAAVCLRSFESGEFRPLPMVQSIGSITAVSRADDVIDFPGHPDRFHGGRGCRSPLAKHTADRCQPAISWWIRRRGDFLQSPFLPTAKDCDKPAPHDRFEKVWMQIALSLTFR